MAKGPQNSWREALLRRVEPIGDAFRSADAWAEGVMAQRRVASKVDSIAAIGVDNLAQTPVRRAQRAGAGGVFNDGVYRPDRDGDRSNLMSPSEFTFIGGAGTGGAYLSDFQRAFNEAGIRDVKVPNNGDHDLTDPHVLSDALSVAMVNDMSFANSLVDSADARAAAEHSRQIRSKGEQFNLGGYSYGSAASAALAEAIARNGGYVDNLVLIGAPINADLYRAVTTNPNIGRVIMKDLTDKGDPVRPGMSDWDLARKAPKLMGQARTSEGHFYYSGTDAEGRRRRDALAAELVRRGLK